MDIRYQDKVHSVNLGSWFPLFKQSEQSVDVLFSPHRHCSQQVLCIADELSAHCAVCKQLNYALMIFAECKFVFRNLGMV